MRQHSRLNPRFRLDVESPNKIFFKTNKFQQQETKQQQKSVIKRKFSIFQKPSSFSSPTRNIYETELVILEILFTHSSSWEIRANSPWTNSSRKDLFSILHHLWTLTRRKKKCQKNAVTRKVFKSERKKNFQVQ
jgi:hypothetical protein